MEQDKSIPEVSNTPPMPRNLRPPARPLGSRFIPVVVHPGGHPLNSFEFVFYRPEFPNTLAPFTTLQKPSCGFQFQESTQHRRQRMDVDSANVAKWRSLYRRKP
uniref:Uncharacterized protein n=1 Tax=Malurus cyaneus samueli TaxID=2593467 RepID=A0A8C5TEF9_9PASS